MRTQSEKRFIIFKRVLKSLLATGIAIIPIVISEYTLDSGDKIHVISGLALCAFLASWLVFKPDLRFLTIRKPTLNSALDKKFEDVYKQLDSNDRLPFRVNVMQPCGWPYWWTMKIVYEYGMKHTDSDYAMPLPRERGLCWEVLKTNSVGWYDSREHSPKDYGLNSEEIKKTSHIKALLSFPIRSAHGNDGQKVDAVLNIDALSDEAADFLKNELELLKNNQNKTLSELVEYFGLYF